MRRADRLLQIIEILRRETAPISAGRMAQELEVSKRTLYRDIVSLEANGVPIRGEPGVGYVLEDGFDLPPLMFSLNELEAIILGARLLDGRLDDDLTNAARSAVAKIAGVIPDDHREHLLDTPIFAPIFGEREDYAFDVSEIRRAIRAEHPLEIDYVDLSEQQSSRVIWPIFMSMFDETNVMAAWCTLRRDFRSFRLERITRLSVTDGKFGKPRRYLNDMWRKKQLDLDFTSLTAKDKTGRFFGIRL